MSDFDPTLPTVAEDYEGTDLAIELATIGSETWAETAIAGLQYYDYGRADELAPNGIVLPAPGDRVSLVREPDNAAHENAVEVIWRNSFKLGHLPWGVANAVAPALDAGRALRGYVVRPGTGSAWSMIVLLVGAAVADLHGERIERAVAVAAESVWPTSTTYQRYAPDATAGAQGLCGARERRVVEPRQAPPTEAQRWAVKVWGWDQEKRREDAAAALSVLVDLYDDAPDGYDDPPDESWRGRRIGGAWERVPAWLATASTWKRRGYRPRAGAKPFAFKVGGMYGAEYDLWCLADCEPLPVSALRAKQRAAAKRAAAVAVEEEWF